MTSIPPRRAGISIMPIDYQVLQNVLSSNEYNFKGAGIMTSEMSEAIFQGSVSISDAQTAVNVSFLTNAEQIEAMLPPGKNLKVNGPPLVTVSAVYQGGLKWLAGRTYNLVLVMIPVVHNGKNGNTYGFFLPVVWENMTEPILTGRELLGWPKIYADLPPARILNDTFQRIAHWYGFTFLEINVNNVRALSEEELKQRAENAAKNETPSSGLICHKFIRKTGSLTFETDADYLTISTSEGAAQSTIREVLTGKAGIRFVKGTFEQLPTMEHIIESLANLEIKEVYDATIVTQTGGGMGTTRILE